MAVSSIVVRCSCGSRIAFAVCALLSSGLCCASVIVVDGRFEMMVLSAFVVDICWRLNCCFIDLLLFDCVWVLCYGCC